MLSTFCNHIFLAAKQRINLQSCLFMNESYTKYDNTLNQLYEVELDQLDLSNHSLEEGIPSMQRHKNRALYGTKESWKWGHRWCWSNHMANRQQGQHCSTLCVHSINYALNYMLICNWWDCSLSTISRLISFLCILLLRPHILQNEGEWKKRWKL